MYKHVHSNELGKEISKTTQSESQFKGKFLKDSKIKILWILVFFGPIGFFSSFFISIKKE